MKLIALSVYTYKLMLYKNEYLILTAHHCGRVMFAPGLIGLAVLGFIKNDFIVDRLTRCSPNGIENIEIQKQLLYI